MLKGKTILIGVTGGIAAYKIPNLVSMLVKARATVHVLMTPSAAQFITPLTFETLSKNRCIIDTFDRNFDFKVEHVSLAKQADLFMVAPATANTIAKLAHGIADNMLTTTFLACTCPKILVPAMNTAMLENPLTQDNLAFCEKYGMKVVESACGHLACGDDGKGKMPEPSELFEIIKNHFCGAQDLKGKKILVTAGPTQEVIDPVRYITNHSTGKMGYAMAKAAANRGAEVVLVSGPVNLPCPQGVERIDVVSAKEMFEAVKENYQDCDIIIKSAAVADYRPAVVAGEKIKKMEGEAKILLERTDDILKYVGEHKREGQILCGFSMETENMVENSRAKLAKKNLDMVVANNLKVKGAGFGTDTNIVTLITKDGVNELPIMTKEEVADKILDCLKEF